MFDKKRKPIELRRRKSAEAIVRDMNEGIWFLPNWAEKRINPARIRDEEKGAWN